MWPFHLALHSGAWEARFDSIEEGAETPTALSDRRWASYDGYSNVQRHG